ncbi:MAG: RNA polymerase sigma factor [Planctomycetia bacterium]|nr:RNA polymerase sigma factor [Planctomycetia bacterium]
MFDEQTTQSDAALIARVRVGETNCFGEIARRYQPALMRVARSRLGRADWAEDVVQETFLAAFKSCGGYDSRFSFRTWLWTILLNQCRGHYQHRLRSVPLEPWPKECEPTIVSEQGDESGSPLVHLLAKERSAQLESLLGQLSLVQADALRLRFYGGLKFQEIADAMQCSLTSAKNRVRWGLMRMAELLQTAGAQGTPPSDLATLKREEC